ncbi:hypothetical protein X772_16020 [Mesorhizobium sp. LSJC280B00]|nr:hypothetical protein X772_16020 [Mesorhizobium sp. LSJC280B00]
MVRIALPPACNQRLRWIWLFGNFRDEHSFGWRSHLEQHHWAASLDSAPSRGERTKWTTVGAAMNRFTALAFATFLAITSIWVLSLVS